MINTDNPFFSVVVPIYNKLPYLERCINSVLNQTYKDFELLLIDDCSTDGSFEFLSTYNDERIRIFRRPEPGPAGNLARQLGVESATGQWIAFLDADDCWNELFLEKVNSAILDHPDIQLFCSAFEVKNGSRTTPSHYAQSYGHLGDHEFDIEDFLIKKPCHTSNMVINKKTLIDLGGFYTGQYHRCGDVETWLRAMYSIRKGYWLEYIGSSYYNDIPGSAIHTITPYLFEHPVRQFVKNQLKDKPSDSLEKALKKHSNSFILSTLKFNTKSSKVYPWHYTALFYHRSLFKKRTVLMFFLSFVPGFLRKKLI